MRFIPPVAAPEPAPATASKRPLPLKAAAPTSGWRGALQRFFRPVYRPVWRAVRQWLDADGLRMSAAMSFYGLLSLAPLLVLLVAALGWWLDRTYVEVSLIAQIRSVVGAQGALLLQQVINSAKEPSEGITASLLAFALLLSGATGVFAELQDAFERLWRTGSAPPVRQKWWRGAALRLRGVAYILAFGFLLLVSLSVSAVLAVAARWAGSYLPVKALGLVTNEVVSFAFCTGLFVALMRLSAAGQPPLRFLVMGAVVGAVLFAAGKQLMALYLSTAAVVSAYGAAGSLVVLLMWIYFSSAVLLLAASVAKSLADEAAVRAHLPVADAGDAPKNAALGSRAC